MTPMPLISATVFSNTVNYFDVILMAQKGPIGTRDYRIQLDAVGAPDRQTFLHLTYAYGFNLTGRLAILGNLATSQRRDGGT
jgi:hypothetical protein